MKKIIIILIVILTIQVNNLIADNKIAIVKNTAELSQFNEVSSNFISALGAKKGFSFVEYNLKEIEPEKVAAEIKKSNISLIYALGDVAAREMTNRTENIPIIFSLILNYKNPKLNIFNNPKVVGISSQVPFEITMLQMQMLVPNAVKIGILYSDRSNEMVQDIKKSETDFNIKILDVKIENDKKIEGALKKLFKDGAQAIYMVADPIIYTKEGTELIIETCKKNKIPFIAYSDAFVKKGALMSVSPSYPTIGSQAAAIAEKLLIDKVKPQDVGIEAPIGSFFVINMLTSQEIGLTTNESITSVADKVYRE